MSGTHELSKTFEEWKVYSFKELFDFISDAQERLDATLNELIIQFRPDYSNVYYPGETPDVEVTIRRPYKNEIVEDKSRVAGFWQVNSGEQDIF